MRVALQAKLEVVAAAKGANIRSVWQCRAPTSRHLPIAHLLIHGLLAIQSPHQRLGIQNLQTLEVQDMIFTACTKRDVPSSISIVVLV